MSVNTELMLHVSSKGDNEGILEKTKGIISDYWKQGEVVNLQRARDYRELWKIQRRSISRVSGRYGAADNSKAPIDIDIMKMSWSNYLLLVKDDPHHGFRERCDLLGLVRESFRDYKSFSDMELEKRKTIAGLPNNWNEHWAWFGSMRGAGYYHQAINENSPHISGALDHIPLKGRVTLSDYSAYIDRFIQAFPNGRDGVGIASRLLALKRPDQFVCLDSKNRELLCKEFQIPKSNINYEKYWEQIVCRIMDSVWWNSPKPEEKVAEHVWLGRAAMLDAIFYEP